MSTILITDGEHRSALAAARSLGRAGHRIIVCSSSERPLAGASKHVAESVQVSRSADDAAVFLENIRSLVDRQSVDVLLPMTDTTVGIVLRARESLDGVLIPYPDRKVYEAASDKKHVTEVAAELGIPAPAQVVVERPDDIPNLLQADWVQRAPALILKPSRSAVHTSEGVLSFGVAAAAGARAARARLGDFPDEAFPILVQEKIEGPGLGVFLLSWGGKVRASFAHRRIREKPPHGGVSVYRESVPVSAELLDYSERLLGHWGWDGVAMVEFKERRESGTPYLMEINARFWGSLQLAIDAGVDFPKLLVAVAQGEDVPAPEYTAGVRSRWLWGEVDHLIAVLRAGIGQRLLHPEYPTRFDALRHLVLPWRPGDRFEVLRPSDPRPFLRESLEWFRSLRS